MLSHVELTVPATMLRDDHRAGLDRLLCGAFGWSLAAEDAVNPADGVARHTCTYRLGNGQSLVLREGDEAFRSGPDDHLGVAVESEELDRIFAACVELSLADDRVAFKYVVDGQPSAVKLPQFTFRTFFVRHTLPLWIQVEARAP